jgi:hypothetical protein
LKKTLKIVSNTAPFIAAVATSAGATKAAYETTCPLASSTVSMIAPRPSPMPSR